MKQHTVIDLQAINTRLQRSGEGGYMRCAGGRVGWTTHHNRESVKSCSDGRPETGNSSRRPNKEKPGVAKRGDRRTADNVHRSSFISALIGFCVKSRLIIFTDWVGFVVSGFVDDLCTCVFVMMPLSQHKGFVIALFLVLYGSTFVYVHYNKWYASDATIRLHFNVCFCLMVMIMIKFWILRTFIMYLSSLIVFSKWQKKNKTQAEFI